MKRYTKFATLLSAPFYKAVGVICSLWLFSGVVGQKAIAPEKPAEEQKNDGAEAFIMAKLNQIFIPAIIFEDVSIEEAFGFIRTRTRELDILEKDPTHKGISFHTTRPPAAQAGEPAVVGNDEVRISDLQLRNVSVLSALKYTCLLTNLSFSVTEHGVVITAKMQGAKETVIPVNEIARQELITRLNSITVPQIDFEKVSLSEAVNSLLPRSRWRDPQSKEAINFVIGKPLGDKATVIEKLQLKETTLSEALKRICEVAHYDITVDDTAVILMPQKSK